MNTITDKYERKAIAAAKKFKALIAKQFVMPEGFTGKWEASWYGKADDQYTIINAAQTIKVALRYDGEGEISGDTEYNPGDGWLTFSRLGISDSFYWSKRDGQPLLDCLNEQIERAQQGIKRAPDMIALPLVNARINKSAVELYKKRLAKGQSIDLTPAGFGTGYHVCRKFSRWARRSVELEKFFGMSPLYAEAFDCD